MSDFELMLERKKEEKRKRKRRKDIDLINDNDDAIAKMIADMRLAARDELYVFPEKLGPNSIEKNPTEKPTEIKIMMPLGHIPSTARIQSDCCIQGHTCC